MLDFIRGPGSEALGVTHRIYFSYSDRLMSDAGILHRFIAQLKLARFEIEAVDFCETPLFAEVTFSERSMDETVRQGFRSFFKRKRMKTDERFKLKLSVNNLDKLAWLFFIEYSFSDWAQADDDPQQELASDEDIHGMLHTAFEGYPAFLKPRTTPTRA